MRSSLMMIDMSGPDIEAVDEVKVLRLLFVIYVYFSMIASVLHVLIFFHIVSKKILFSISVVCLERRYHTSGNDDAQ
jgi:hypothetical protein